MAGNDPRSNNGRSIPEIEAGSTGKPNRAAELANIERIMPFLLQIPGIDPKWLAKELLNVLMIN